MGPARTGSKQRQQAMSYTIHPAIMDWRKNHPEATDDEKLRLDLGFVTSQVQRQSTLGCVTSGVWAYISI
jgi:hypothetical protein